MNFNIKFNKIVQFLYEKRIVFAVVFFVTIVFAGWFKSGFIIGADFQYRSTEHLASLCAYSTWDSTLNGGSYTVASAQLSKLPFFLSECLLNNFFDYNVIQRLLWLFPFLIIGTSSMIYLLKYIYNNNTFIFFGSIFYLLNPIILERIQRAHVWMPLVYALLPIMMLLILKISEKSKINFRNIFLGSLSGVIFWIEPRVAVLAILFIFLLHAYLVVFTKASKKIFLVTWLMNGMIILLLNVFWILPLIMYPPQELYPREMMNVNSLIGVGKYSGTILNAIQLFPLAWKQFYVPIYLSTIIIIILFLLQKNKKIPSKLLKIIPFLAIALLGLFFLGKGTNAPFENIYLWLELNVPLFIGYRVSSKFLLVAALPFAIIFGYATTSLINSRMSFNKFASIVTVMIIFLSGASFIFNGYAQMFQGASSYYLNEPNMFWPKKDFTKLNEYTGYVQAHFLYSRTMWFPKVNRHRFASYFNTTISSTPVLNKKSILYDFFNLDNGKFYAKEQKNISNYFYWLGVNSVIINDPEVPDWAYTKKHNYPDIVSKLDNNSGFKQYSLNTDDAERLFVLQNMKYNTIDLLNIDKISLSNISFDSKSKTAQFAEDEMNSIVFSIDNNQNIFNKNKAVLLLRMITDIDEYINISFIDSKQQEMQSVAFIKKSNGDVNDFTIEIPKRLEDVQKIKISNIYFNNKIKFNAVKIISSNSYGDANIEKIYATSNILSAKDNIPSRCASFQFINPIGGALTLVQLNTLSNIDSLNILKLNDCDFDFEKINSITNHIKIDIINDKPTKKDLRIIKYNNDAYIVIFAEKYDKYWILKSKNNQNKKYKHIMVNGYMNAWVIDANDNEVEFTLEFIPQRWFYLGLLISGTTFIALVSYLGYNMLKRRRKNFYKDELWKSI